MKKGQTVLESFIAPPTAEQLFADYWPERVYASHGDLDRLPGMFRSPVLHDIETLSEHYHGRVLFTRGRHSPFMVPAKNGCPKTLFNMGLTVYLVKDDEAGDRVTASMDTHPQAVAVFEWLAARTAPFGIDDLQQQFPQFPRDQRLAMLNAAASAELIRMLWYPLLDS